MKTKSASQLVSTFFTLSFKEAAISRRNLFSQIHEIVFHGKGGYDWETVYRMPIWLRNFTYQQISDFYEKEAEATKKANSKSSNSQNTTVINPQDFVKGRGPAKY